MKKKGEVTLLKRALLLMPDLVDAHCGNSEGTPCDDGDHSYVCAFHKWIADVRATVQRSKRSARARRSAITASTLTSSL